MNHINTINNNKSINSVQHLEQHKTKIMNKYRSEHSEHVAKHYFLHKELTEEEYNQCINDLEECLLHPPEKYNTTELIQSYKDSVQHEILLIKRDQEQTRNFNIFLKEKEDELNQYPTNNSKLLSNLSKYITTRSNYYLKDLFDSYFDMFVEKVTNLCPEDKDYNKTIRSVYTCRNSRKATDSISNIFHKITTTFNSMIQYLNHSPLTCYYTIQKILEKEFDRLLSVAHTLIYNFISNRLDCYDDEQMNDSRAVKAFCEMIMSDLNNDLINILPVELGEELSIRCQDRIENIDVTFQQQFNISLVALKPPEPLESLEPPANQKQLTITPIIQEKVNQPEIRITKPTLESFIENLPLTPIELSILTERYNQTFGTNLSSNSLSKIKNFRPRFTVTQKKINGKCVTVYTKINH